MCLELTHLAWVSNPAELAILHANQARHVSSDDCASGGTIVLQQLYYAAQPANSMCSIMTFSPNKAVSMLYGGMFSDEFKSVSVFVAALRIAHHSLPTLMRLSLW